MAVLAFGYADEAPKARARKSLHDVAIFLKQYLFNLAVLRFTGTAFLVENPVTGKRGKYLETAKHCAFFIRGK